MNNLVIKPKLITKKNFKKFGDMITTDDIKPLEINEGYAKRFDGVANLDTKKDNGESIISIFSALKRSFPMKVDMMEKHPLGSQAFIPMKETTFLAFVAPEGEEPDLSKVESFIIPKGIGVNYNSGVVDRKGNGDNLVIHDLNKENITLEFLL